MYHLLIIVLDVKFLSTVDTFERLNYSTFIVSQILYIRMVKSSYDFEVSFFVFVRCKIIKLYVDLEKERFIIYKWKQLILLICDLFHDFKSKMIYVLNNEQHLIDNWVLLKFKNIMHHKVSRNWSVIFFFFFLF